MGIDETKTLCFMLTKMFYSLLAFTRHLARVSLLTRNFSAEKTNGNGFLIIGRIFPTRLSFSLSLSLDRIYYSLRHLRAMVTHDEF